MAARATEIAKEHDRQAWEEAALKVEAEWHLDPRPAQDYEHRVLITADGLELHVEPGQAYRITGGVRAPDVWLTGEICPECKQPTEAWIHPDQPVVMAETIALRDAGKPFPHECDPVRDEKPKPDEMDPLHGLGYLSPAEIDLIKAVRWIVTESIQGGP